MSNVPLFARLTLYVPIIYLLAGCVGADPLAPGDTARPPAFASVTPSTTRIQATVGERVDFQIRVEDASGQSVTIKYFVDGVQRATGASFSFEPPSPGDYRVEGVASSGDAESRHTWTVEANQPAGPPPNEAPTAELVLDPASGTAPLDVRLRLGGRDADGEIVRYRIEVSGPDGASIEGSTPIDTVLTLGTGDHPVTATVEDDRGDEDVTTATVSVAAPANRAPIPALKVEPTTGMAPLDVVIEGTGSDPDGEIVRYALDMDGDGTFEMDAPTPLVQSVRYPEAGKVWVRLEVTDDRGVSSRDSLLVRVSAADPQPAPNQAPTLSLDVTPTSGEAPLEVHASVAGSDPDGAVVAASIDFDGDGTADASSSSATLDGVFTYSEAGTWTVRATVVDDDGASTTSTRTVTVTEPDTTGPDGGQDSTPNSPPTGSLAADRATGDATLTVSLTAVGSDPDGDVTLLEIDPDDGGGFVEVGEDGRLEVAYPFRDDPYQTRVRITDNDGAATVEAGPEIVVHRPVDVSRSGGTASGNSRFASFSIDPAVWSDGQDRLRFTVTVRDHAGEPLADVPVRVRSLRSVLVAPDGSRQSDLVAVALDAPRTDANGRLTGSATTRTSTRVEAMPSTGEFVSFRLKVEADAGHGEWRRLPDIRELDAETIVDGNSGVGQFFVKPAGLTCVGDPLEIHVRAFRRDDAPGAGGPADGRYTEIRYAVNEERLDVVPMSGYGSWRTDSAGWIKFRYTPQEPDSKAMLAWVDGQPLNITAAIAAIDCP